MKSRLALIVLLVSAVSAADAQRELRGQKLELPAELKAAFEKAKALRFSGVRKVTVVRAGRIQTHSEYVTKDGSNLRIEFSKESPFYGQIIVESTQDRRHYFPDKNEIRVYPSFGKKQFEAFRGGFRSPRGGTPKFETANGGVISGFHCTRYQLSDKDSNPIVQVFLEPHSGMILKRVVFDPTGDISGSYEFTSLTLNPTIQKGAFTISRRNAKVIRPIDELRFQAKGLGVPALSLKAATGYKLSSVYVREMSGSKTIIQNYFQGDSYVTLFITKSALDPNDLRKFNRGELRSYSRTLKGVTLVLIGDQPEERLRTLSNQVDD
jgi:outer membrane lipoprotein-sorting protein